ncbi:hypothetical protein [Staphylococcus phage vB_SurM-PSU4]|nr:hypothetical protein [Staphylococcus phage vB_SurM-PSU4]
MKTTNQMFIESDIEKLQGDIDILVEEFATGKVNREMVMKAIDIKMEEIEELKNLI